MPWICRYGVVDCPECKRAGLRPTWVAEAPSATATDRVYFRIPYADKEQAKALGARWDADRKLWYGLNTNPKLSEIGRRWRPVDAPKPKKVDTVPDLFDVTATTTEVGSSQADAVAEDPPPGLFSFDELMDAIKAADAAQAPQQAAYRLPVAPSKKDNANAR